MSADEPACGVILCRTDHSVCTCGAPADTPAGMHRWDCPTNPASGGDAS